MRPTLTPPDPPPLDATPLRAILEDPADDAARLVYADWLEERGESRRAEFIRVQVELACLAAPTDRPSGTVYASVSLHQRLAELFEGGPWEFLDGIDQALKPGKPVAVNYGLAKPPDQCAWRIRGHKGDRQPVYLRFTRGFVSEIALRCSTFLNSVEQLFRTHPIEHIHMSPWVSVGEERILADLLRAPNLPVPYGCARAGVKRKWYQPSQPPRLPAILAHESWQQ